MVGRPSTVCGGDVKGGGGSQGTGGRFTSAIGDFGDWECNEPRPPPRLASSAQNTTLAESQSAKSPPPWQAGAKVAPQGRPAEPDLRLFGLAAPCLLATCKGLEQAGHRVRTTEIADSTYPPHLSSKGEGEWEAEARGKRVCRAARTPFRLSQRAHTRAHQSHQYTHTYLSSSSQTDSSAQFTPRLPLATLAYSTDSPALRGDG